MEALPQRKTECDALRRHLTDAARCSISDKIFAAMAKTIAALTPAPTSGSIPPSVVSEQVERICASTVFAHSARMRRFLTYVVNETLAGRGSNLKEYAIALNVYDKPSSFDPRVDSIVRVEAGRLRKKLQKYYLAEGQHDAVLVRVSASSYIPEFRLLNETEWGRPNHASDEQRSLHLKAHYFFNRRDPVSLASAVDFFTAAAGTEAGFVDGMAGQAACYTASAWLEFNAPEAAWSKAVWCSRRALQKSPDLAEALTVVACEKALHRWDWAGAEREFEQAIGTDTTCLSAYQCFSLFCLAPQGRFDEALHYLDRARRLDPNSEITSCCIGRLYYLKRLCREAVLELSRSIRLHPKFFPAYCDLGMVYAQLQLWHEASTMLAAAREIANQPLAIAGMGYVAGLSGQRDEALEARASLMELSRTQYVSPVSFALVDLALGNTDDAFDQLDRALDARAARVTQLAVDPAFDPIKTDPRFIRILSRLAL